MANAIELLTKANWFDLTQALSIFTPPWPGEMPLQVHFFKRLTGSWGGGQGANGQLIEWSNNTGTHLVGPRAFHSGAQPIADIGQAQLCGEGVVVDLSDVEQINSGELGELAKIHLFLRQHDRKLILANVQDLVWEVFELTRMNRLIDVRHPHVA